MMKREDCPSCFGVLDIVFPKGEDGLRTVPEACFACSHKTECLKTAMSEESQGLKAQAEFVDRAYESGMIGFLERWSEKKALHRKAQRKADPRLRQA